MKRAREEELDAVDGSATGPAGVEASAVDVAPAEVAAKSQAPAGEASTADTTPIVVQNPATAAVAAVPASAGPHFKGSHWGSKVCGRFDDPLQGPHHCYLPGC